MYLVMDESVPYLRQHMIIPLRSCEWRRQRGGKGREDKERLWGKIRVCLRELRFKEKEFELVFVSGNCVSRSYGGGQGVPEVCHIYGEGVHELL